MIYMTCIFAEVEFNSDIHMEKKKCKDFDGEIDDLYEMGLRDIIQSSMQILENKCHGCREQDV